MGGPAIIDGKIYTQLDNFYRCFIEYNEMLWQSSEQLYQGLKFTDIKYIKEINKKGINPGTAWTMGQSREHPLIDNFEEEKINLMYRANWEKFSQNQALKRTLLSTTGKIKFTKSSPFWNRQNGLILERIRDELKVKKNEPKVKKNVLRQLWK